MDDPPALAVDLVADLDPALGRPRCLDRGRPAVLEAEDRDGVVLAGRLVGVAERRAPGEDLGDPDVLADDVAGRLDAVTAHVQERAAAGGLGIPEVRRMRPGVALTRAHREDPSERARRHHLGDLDDLRAEDLVLHVAVEHARVLDEAEHLGRLRGVPAERLRAQDALAGRGRGPDRLEMEVVGEGDDDEVDLGVGAQAGHRVVASARSRGRSRRPRPARRPSPAVRHRPGARHVPEAGQVVVAR